MYSKTIFKQITNFIVPKKFGWFFLINILSSINKKLHKTLCLYLDRLEMLSVLFCKEICSKSFDNWDSLISWKKILR